MIDLRAGSTCVTSCQDGLAAAEPSFFLRREIARHIRHHCEAAGGNPPTRRAAFAGKRSRIRLPSSFVDPNNAV